MNINQMFIVYTSEGGDEKTIWKDIILVVPLDFIPSDFGYFLGAPEKEQKDDFIVLDFSISMSINNNNKKFNSYTKKKLSPLFVKNLLIQNKHEVRAFRYNKKETNLHEISNDIFGDYTPREFIRGDMDSVLKFLKESINVKKKYKYTYNILSNKR